MNLVILEGRLAKDVEVKNTSTGKAVAQFTLAVSKKGKDAGADFIPCVIWNAPAEALAKYKSKGDELLVRGHLQIRSYDAEGGKRYVTEVIVDEMEFVGGAKKAESKPDFGTAVNEEIPF